VFCVSWDTGAAHSLFLASLLLTVAPGWAGLSKRELLTITGASCYRPDRYLPVAQSGVSKPWREYENNTSYCFVRQLLGLSYAGTQSLHIGEHWFTLKHGAWVRSNHILSCLSVCLCVPCGLRGVMHPWFICWFWHYIHCLLVHLASPTFFLFSSLICCLLIYFLTYLFIWE